MSELSLDFDYNANQLQWLLLAPGLINWVTQDTHLGLYRNYFGQDVDDVFIADNEWSSQFQCTPAATDPPDYTCPAGVANNPADAPPDVQMSAADVAYVVNWEQQTGIKLNLAFNAVGACTAPSAATESSANCTGSVTDNGATYTDPGQDVDASAPTTPAFVNALLADQGRFNWINHTWSHLFLGCTVYSRRPSPRSTANGSGGTFTAGTYNYEITAATAYGESEPSAPQTVAVGANGSVTLTWPEATNGTGADGTPGPSLAQVEASHTGGTGFWGYNIYRETRAPPPSAWSARWPRTRGDRRHHLHLHRHRRHPRGGAELRARPSPRPPTPASTAPARPAAGCRSPAPPPDSSIDQEIGLNQAFAAANGLTNFTPAAVVTGEHSGVENPNMPAALAAWASPPSPRTPPASPSSTPSGARSGRRATRATSTTTPPTGPTSSTSTTPSTWPRATRSATPRTRARPATARTPRRPPASPPPATEAALLASESRIMLSHVLANNPRVGYAHQSNLIGPATQNGQDYGYTLLTLITDMLSQYNTWYTPTPRSTR